jgi:hypothetical protein
MNYYHLIDKYKDTDKSAFIFGAGPSLYNILYSCSQKDIDKISNNIVITTNSSILAGTDKLGWGKGISDNRYWISNDSLAMRWTWWEDVKKNRCIKIVRTSWEKYKKDLNGFLFFSPRPTSEDIINLEDKGLCYCSSIPSAIDLALQMSVKQVFLLGVDQDLYEGKHHFWQFFDRKKQPRQLRPAQGSWEQQKQSFVFNNMAYNALRGFSKYKNIPIYNCNMDNKVGIFDNMEFNKCISKI